jgi:hypothetical protein
VSIPRPTDGDKGQMTLPPTAWPEADEGAHTTRSSDLRGYARQLQDQLAPWRATQTKLFDGSTCFSRFDECPESSPWLHR